MRIFSTQFAVSVLALTALQMSTPAVQAQKGYTVSRKNLAERATFTVTQEILPQGGSKISQVFKVEVSGNRARLDYNDPNIGDVRYVSNEKGVFFLTPSNNTAVKQEFKGGADAALKLAFSQVNEQMVSAKKVRSEVVSGQPTDVYKDPKTGALIYIGTKPGFLLPVKTVLTNVGGTRTVTVTNIRINPKIDNSRFALPAGVQIIDSAGTGRPSPAGF